MKISYNWIKKYLDINETPEDLAEILTNTGLEVEKVEYIETIPGGLKGLVVGEVLEKNKHTNADKLSVAQVEVGEEAPLQIVCGAKNLEAGQKVVVALVGTTIYPIDGEAFNIKKAKIRGESSYGMICAEDEIGLGASHDGIMVLDSSIKAGTPVSEIFEVENDVVFEIGLTPNRSDAMSHIGVAKDIAAALNAVDGGKRKVKYPAVKSDFNQQEQKVKVVIEDQEACQRYSSITLDNIIVKDAPDWIKNSLLAVGVRPINNVVDITNYVLKEYGQPLHAFDLAAIEDNTVVVRKAKENEAFVCLDGVEKKLSNHDLMICNSTEPMCIAGVFGGKDSGVSANTKAIFLESAYFNSKSIRKTSTSLNLRTDAAQRYEKGADPEITIAALKRAVDLLVEYADATISSKIGDIYPKEIERATVVLSYKRLNTLSGHQFTPKLVKQILLDLDFEIQEENEHQLIVKVPLYRADVTREADVIEEVMRIFGFNNIKTPLSVRSTLSFSGKIDEHFLKESTANILNGLGYSEIMTNSITQSNYYDENTNLVQLQNSMTKELDSLRASLLPEALHSIQHNINRKRTNLKFFEFGSVYAPKRKQKQVLGIYLTGLTTNANWTNKGEKSTIYQLKGLVDSLLKRLNINQCKLIQEEDTLYYSHKKKTIARLAEVSSKQLERFDIKQSVFEAVIEWDEIITILTTSTQKFEQLSKYPEVTRDLAIVVDESLKFEALKLKIEQQGNKILKKIDLFDIFRDKKKIGEHKKSYALSFVLQDKNKTLVDKDIEKFISNTIHLIKKEFNAEIRM